jgi:hypothetical protein
MKKAPKTLLISFENIENQSENRKKARHKKHNKIVEKTIIILIKVN